MIRYCLLLLTLFPGIATFGQFSFAVPDTTRGTGFYAEVTPQPATGTGDGMYQIAGFSRGGIYFVKKGPVRSVLMKFRDSSLSPVFTGIGQDVLKDTVAFSASWKYNWQPGITYKVLLAALPDSAGKTTFYSGYVFLPEKQQWKLLATAKLPLDGDFLRGLYIHGKNVNTVSKRTGDSMQVNNIWLQRTGGWTQLVSQRPVTDLAKNADSSAQSIADKAAIFKAVKDKKLDTTAGREGVYYHILEQGTGEQVSVTDTVSVFYKGYLLSDGSIFDQTKDKPATFPLNRLIKGWQIAIPMCRVGGTVRVIIPSGLAYGIRARSKDIPPNSILVFDVQVVSTKKRMG